MDVCLNANLRAKVENKRIEQFVLHSSYYRKYSNYFKIFSLARSTITLNKHFKEL